MERKHNKKEELNNFLEGLLPSDNLEEAIEILIKEGKNPEAVIQQVMGRVNRAIKKAQSFPKQKHLGVKGIQKSETSNKGIAIIYNYENNQFALEEIELTEEKERVTAEEIYSLRLAKKQLDNYANAVWQEELQALKYKKFPLKAQLRFHLEQEDVVELSFFVKGTLLGEIPMSRAEFEHWITLGYWMDEKQWYPIEKESIEQIKEVLNILDNAGDQILQKVFWLYARRKKYTCLSFVPEEIEPVELHQLSEKQQREKLFTKELYDYQEFGLAWLKGRCLNLEGGILGDDMGLGKTAQVIALVCWLLESGTLENLLIVVPSTLLENWKREFQFFAPKVKTHIHHGAYRGGSHKRLNEQDVVITSYSMIINDQYLFNKIDWGLIVLDEASLIKNHHSERHIALKGISGEVRIAMTGTPVENSLKDLWSITDFSNEGYLESFEEFKKTYIRKSVNETLEQDLSDLKKRVDKIMLRRKKEDVLDNLPDRIDIPQALSLQAFESECYHHRRNEILKSKESKGKILKMIMDLRMYTTHPFLLDKERLQKASLKEMTSNCQKMERTLQLLDEIKERKEKVIIFTEYLDMIDKMKELFEAKYKKEVFHIDGRIDIPERQGAIDKFSAQEGFSMMVLNPRTAGMGLNITSANHVIHYTRQWNPALEEQASARAYRNKQTKDVNIYYMYYVDTIEEVIDKRLQEKRELSDQVIVPIEEMDINEILNFIKE
ncbi:DEAD/DEAH box helicase [Sediminitomix flava]|uniref:Helicase-like protein n=1 Tax=Sediminitomix flava TaxID=379075 RepID=A0A315ZAQ8_SEDFL|nr:DEAD/DEAH box helicase [Sediminitomix flava]PWJ42665.1 helicase-like protein [Sediminitomix flava]